MKLKGKHRLQAHRQFLDLVLRLVIFSCHPTSQLSGEGANLMRLPERFVHAFASGQDYGTGAVHAAGTPVAEGHHSAQVEPNVILTENVRPALSGVQSGDVHGIESLS